jgi:hypothetical protein
MPRQESGSSSFALQRATCSCSTPGSLPYRSGDLLFEDHHASEGDWIIAFCEHEMARVLAFGRVNRTASPEDGLAASSLFWLFTDGGPALSHISTSPVGRHPALLDTTVIRQLVSWFDRHYRVGLFRSPQP